MTDVFENQPEPHRATSLPERQRAALTAIGPENGKRAQQRRGALTAAQGDRAVAWRPPHHERAARGAGGVDCEVRARTKEDAAGFRERMTATARSG